VYSKGLCKPHYGRAYYEANWEELREYGRVYQKAHPEQYCAADARRRKRAGEGLDALDKALAVDYRVAIANDPCGYCGTPADHTDHVFPIAKGGRDVWYNLMRACEPCNLTKGPRCGTWFRMRTGCW
jgi:5-methylcytosine-specific restriction endonuclease McrA